MKRMTLAEFVKKHENKLPYIKQYGTNFGGDIASYSNKPFRLKCPIPTCTEALWMADYEGFVKGHLATQKLKNKNLP